VTRRELERRAPGAILRGVKRPLLAAAGCYALLALVLLAPALLAGRDFLPLHTATMLPWRAGLPAERLVELRARENRELSDKLWLIDPDSSVAADSWRRGELPTWNPSIVGGVPFLGQAIHGLLYPPNLLLGAIAPLERAWAWAAAMHVVIAGLGTFVCARRLGLRPAAALLAGALFAAGGALTVQLHMPMRYYALAWVPWLLAATHAFVERPGALRFAAIPPPVALVILSGFPQNGLYGIVGAALFGVGRLLIAGPPRRWRALLALAAAFGLGGALAAAQVLPVDDAMRRALPRAHDAAQQVRESGTRWMLAGYLVPGAFQDPGEEWSLGIATNPLWSGLYCALERQSDGTRLPSGVAARPSLTETGCYLGAIGLVLALAAIAGRPGRGATPLALALLVALAACWAYALGDPFLVTAAARLPRLDVGEVRRIVGTIGLLGALLAAAGAQRLLAPEAVAARRFAIAAAGLLALALLATFVAVDRSGPEGLSGWLRARQVARYGAELLDRFGAAPPDPATAEAIHAFVGGRLAAASGWFAVACAALLLVHGLLAAERPRWAAAVLLLAAAGDLAALHFRTNPFVAREELFADDPLLAPLATDRSGGRVHRFAPDFGGLGDDPIAKLVLPPNLGARFGIEDAEGYLVAVPTRYARYAQALEPEARPGESVATVAVLPLRTTAALRSPLLDALAVRHVLTRHDLLAALAADGGGDGGFRLVAERGEARVYENREALDLVLVLPEAHLLPAAPPDDDIGTMDEARRHGASRAATPAHDERLALHRGALSMLAARPELLRERLYLEIDPAAAAAAGRGAFRSDAVEIGVERDGAVVPATLRRLRAPAASSVVAVERGAKRLRVELSGEGGGFLLVNEGFDPGWTARVDGVEAAVTPANVAFRGVVLPAGAREVVLEYRPSAVARGLALSAGALSALLGVLAVGCLSAARARRSGSRRPAAAPAG